MPHERPAYGSLISAIGSALLGVSVFLPWYGVKFTAGGLAAAQQIGDHAVSQYGNAALQGEWASLQGAFSQLAGHELVTVSAHQALHTINVVLLVLAGLSLLVSLRPLAGRDSALPEVPGAWSAALGAVAALLVLYRMIVPPLPGNGLFAISLHEGAWLALLSAVAMVLGGLWQPGLARVKPASQGELERAWSGLSGWTPPN
jgi:hypothetical protein